MIKTLSAAVLAASVALIPVSAMASTMPKADFGSRPTLGLGVGNGVGVSFDYPVQGSSLSLGIAANLARFSAADVNLRGLYKLTRVDRLEIDLLGGADVITGNGTASPFYPFLGVAFAFPLTNQLVARANLAANLFNFGGYEAAGFELGYKFTGNLEGTIGANGRGDFLGLKLTI